MSNKMLSVVIGALVLTIIFLSWQNVILNKKIKVDEKIIQKQDETIFTLKNDFTCNNKKFIGIHELTFYTHTGNNTASGKYPQANRTIAVDTQKIPLGSIVYIEGYGTYIAEDTGNNIKNMRIDIFVDTHEQAIKNGRKKAKVYLLHK